MVEIGGEQIVTVRAAAACDHRGNRRLPLKFGSGVKPLLVGDVAESASAKRVSHRRGHGQGRGSLARRCHHAGR
jgi:hypothetical protein